MIIVVKLQILGEFSFNLCIMTAASYVSATRCDGPRACRHGCTHPGVVW